MRVLRLQIVAVTLALSMAGSTWAGPPPTGTDDLALGFENGATGGNIDVLNVAPPYASLQFVKSNFGSYLTAQGNNARIRPAFCDLDGDGTNEVVLGFGPGGGGFIEIRDDAAAGFAFIKFVNVGFNPYNGANGETYIACGNIDGDPGDEIAVGYGQGGKGFVKLIEDNSQNNVPVAGTPIAGGFLKFPLAGNYNTNVGITHPAIGNLDSDSQGEIVIGASVGSSGFAFMYDHTGGAFVPLPGTPIPGGWIRILLAGTYRPLVGTIWPAVCNLDGSPPTEAGQLVLGVGAGGPQMAGGFAEIRDAAAGFAKLAGTPIPGGFVRLKLAGTYNTINGTVKPICGNTDTATTGDELFLGTGTGGQGFAEEKRSMDGAPPLGTLGFPRGHIGAYNNAGDGATNVAVGR